MKKLLLGLLLIAFTSSCTFEGAENDAYPESKYKVINIDSCEYIYISRRPYGSDFSVTHKGNCKNPIHKCK
jgi:hypothetical protein